MNDEMLTKQFVKGDRDGTHDRIGGVAWRSWPGRKLKKREQLARNSQSRLQQQPPASFLWLQLQAGAGACRQAQVQVQVWAPGVSERRGKELAWLAGCPAAQVACWGRRAGVAEWPNGRMAGEQIGARRRLAVAAADQHHDSLNFVCAPAGAVCACCAGLSLAGSTRALASRTPKRFDAQQPAVCVRRAACWALTPGSSTTATASAVTLTSP